VEKLGIVPSNPDPSNPEILYVVRTLTEGTCLLNKCEDIRTSSDCRALRETETWASSSKFYEGTWEPNASDGKPAPDGCYIRVSSLTIYWNNRATSQGATKERQKICRCMKTPSSPETKMPSYSKPSANSDPSPKSKSPNCDKFPLYPVDTRSDSQRSRDSYKLSNDTVLFSHVSTGIKFTASTDMFVIGARLRAALAKGTRTWFQLFEFDDDGNDEFIDVSPAVIGTGVGDAERPGFSYYMGKFESLHHLKFGKTYGVSYLLDRTNIYPEWSLQPAVYKTDGSWTNDFAIKMHVLSSNLPWTTLAGDIKFPNIKEDAIPQLDLCE